MSQVHYKFQSSNRHDSVHFDGVSISPSDLRKAILEKERLLQSTDFKLQLQNAQTKEVYEDKDLIPKNSSVTVTRVPISKELKGSQDAENMGEDSHLAYLEKRAASTVSKAEEEQIKAMMHQSTVDYSPDNFQHHGGRPRMQYSNTAPPPGYICNKCGKTGHFIIHCRLYTYGSAPAPPMVNRPRFSAAGIPSDRLRPCDPETPGAQWTRNGWMVNVLDEAAYAEAMQKKSKTPSAPKPAVVFDIPEHFLCNKCNEMMEDAVRTPCCLTNYCDKCIRDILMEDEEQTCPNCNEIEVSPDSLVPENIVRSAISTFLSKSKSGVRRRPDDKPVGSPAAITGTSSPVPVTSNISTNETLSSTTQPASVVSTQAPSVQPSKGTETPDKDIVQTNQTETQSKTESQVQSTSHIAAQGAAAAPTTITAAVPTSTVLSASNTQSVPINNVSSVTASSAVQITMPVAHTVVTSTQLTNNHQTVLPPGTVVTYGTLPNQTLTHNVLAPTGAVFSAGAVIAPIPGTVMSQTYTMPMVNSGAVVPVNYQTPLQVPYNASASTGFTAPGFPAGMRPAAYGAITGPAGLPIPTAADKESALALITASSGRIMSKEEFYKVKATLLEEQIKKTEVKTKNDDVSEFFRDTLGRRRSRSRSPRSPIRRMRSPVYRRSYSRSPSPTRYRSPPPSRYHRRHSRERYRSISPRRSNAPPYTRYNERERRRDRYHEERDSRRRRDDRYELPQLMGEGRAHHSPGYPEFSPDRRSVTPVERRNGERSKFDTLKAADYRCVSRSITPDKRRGSRSPPNNERKSRRNATEKSKNISSKSKRRSQSVEVEAKRSKSPNKKTTKRSVENAEENTEKKMVDRSQSATPPPPEKSKSKRSNKERSASPSTENKSLKSKSNRSASPEKSSRKSRRDGKKVSETTVGKGEKEKSRRKTKEGRRNETESPERKPSLKTSRIGEASKRTREPSVESSSDHEKKKEERSGRKRRRTREEKSEDENPEKVKKTSTKSRSDKDKTEKSKKKIKSGAKESSSQISKKKKRSKKESQEESQHSEVERKDKKKVKSRKQDEKEAKTAHRNGKKERSKDKKHSSTKRSSRRSRSSTPENDQTNSDSADDSHSSRVDKSTVTKLGSPPRAEAVTKPSKIKEVKNCTVESTEATTEDGKSPASESKSSDGENDLTKDVAASKIVNNAVDIAIAPVTQSKALDDGDSDGKKVECSITSGETQHENLELAEEVGSQTQTEQTPTEEIDPQTQTEQTAIEEIDPQTQTEQTHTEEIDPQTQTEQTATEENEFQGKVKPDQAKDNLSEVKMKEAQGNYTEAKLEQTQVDESEVKSAPVQTHTKENESSVKLETKTNGSENKVETQTKENESDVKAIEVITLMVNDDEDELIDDIRKEEEAASEGSEDGEILGSGDEAAVEKAQPPPLSKWERDTEESESDTTVQKKQSAPVKLAAPTVSKSVIDSVENLIRNKAVRPMKADLFHEVAHSRGAKRKVYSVDEVANGPNKSDSDFDDSKCDLREKLRRLKQRKLSSQESHKASTKSAHMDAWSQAIAAKRRMTEERRRSPSPEEMRQVERIEARKSRRARDVTPPRRSSGHKSSRKRRAMRSEDEESPERKKGKTDAPKESLSRMLSDDFEPDYDEISEEEKSAAAESSDEVSTSPERHKSSKSTKRKVKKDKKHKKNSKSKKHKKSSKKHKSDS